MGLSVSSDVLDFGFSYGGTFWSKHLFTGGSFYESRWGVQYAIGGPGFKAGIATSSFNGGGIDQRTGSLVAYGRDWGIRYENDWMWGMPIADGGDRWRTTGINLWVGDNSISLNLATGDPGMKNRPEDNVNGLRTYTGSNANDYRLGALSLGYRGVHLGTNSENVRDLFQNHIAHKGGNKYAVFQKMNNYVTLFGAFKRSNPYTTW